MANKLKLDHFFFGALILAALPASGAQTDPVARVDFAVGDVVSTVPNGAKRNLLKGAQISVGELINTNSGRAQLRFTDGAYMSLQPRTEFRVDNYKFDGKNDGSERGFFSLLSGGIRVITGLVGRGSSDSYQLNTATGVLGVRGTEYSVSYGNSISVTVGTGAIRFCNAGGCLTGTSGQTIYIANADTMPVIVDVKTDLPPTPFPQTQQSFMTTEDRMAGGGLAALTLPQSQRQLQPGTGTYNLAFAHNPEFVNSPFKPGDSHVMLPTSSVSLDAALLMTAFLDTTPPTPGEVTWNGAYDTIGGSGSDGIIAWNRWVSPAQDSRATKGSGAHSNFDLTGGDSLHYVVGVPTPQADMDALRIANVTATYDLLGATPPTSRGASSTIGVLTAGNLFVNFGTSRVTATLVVQTQGPVDPFSFIYSVVGANLPIVSSGFSSPPTSTTVTSLTPGGCVNGCSGTIDGFFAGRNASRAGAAYTFEDTKLEAQTAGAAAFKRQGF